MEASTFHIQSRAWIREVLDREIKKAEVGLHFSIPRSSIL
jgi:hypothetical protein